MESNTIQHIGPELDITFSQPVPLPCATDVQILRILRLPAWTYSWFTTISLGLPMVPKPRPSWNPNSPLPEDPSVTIISYVKHVLNHFR
jgi:hypothetical protein